MPTNGKPSKIVIGIWIATVKCTLHMPTASKIILCIPQIKETEIEKKDDNDKKPYQNIQSLLNLNSNWSGYYTLSNLLQEELKEKE